jgi:heptosyltransferase-2
MRKPKILFVKLGAIGDVAMALSILPAMERSFPGAHLSWMCGQSVEPLLRLFPRINELIVVDDHKLFGRQRLSAMRELCRSILKTVLSRYDLVLHGNTDWRYRFLTCAVRRRETRRWNRHRRRPWPIPARYHGDEYARLMLGDSDGETISYMRPHIDPALLPAQSDLSRLGDFVVLCPGGARNQLADDWRRRWPLKSYVELAKKLIQEGVRIVLVGSDSDAWTRECFDDVPHDDMIGKTDLTKLLSIFREASVVVTHDTASLHLPQLVGTPVVGIFGPTNPAERVPYNFAGSVLWGGVDLGCRPCYDGRFYGSCKANTCLQQISVDVALNSVTELLRTRRS